MLGMRRDKAYLVSTSINYKNKEDEKINDIVGLYGFRCF